MVDCAFYECALCAQFFLIFSHIKSDLVVHAISVKVTGVSLSPNQDLRVSLHYEVDFMANLTLADGIMAFFDKFVL